MGVVTALAVVGSLRAGSANRATARAAIAHAPAHLDLVLYPVADIPLYNGDVEERGLPAPVVALHESVRAADALLFFTPEYNSSLPAVTKNVIDWLSRPPKPAEGLAVSAVAATPGRRAGAGVLRHFEEIMEHQPVRIFETFGVGSYRDKLDENGELTEPATVLALSNYLDRFADFAAETRPES